MRISAIVGVAAATLMTSALTVLAPLQAEAATSVFSAFEGCGFALSTFTDGGVTSKGYSPAWSVRMNQYNVPGRQLERAEECHANGKVLYKQEGSNVTKVHQSSYDLKTPFKNQLSMISTPDGKSLTVMNKWVQSCRGSRCGAWSHD